MAMLINIRQWNIYFLIVGLEKKYFFGKLERPWAHELTSQMGGELMSWSPSVSSALAFTLMLLGADLANTKWCENPEKWLKIRSRLQDLLWING